MFDYKVFKIGGDILLAIADSSLVGKKFSEGDLLLEVKEDFYCESRCSEKEALRLAKSATIVNAVGKQIVSLLSSKGMIDPGNVITIEKIPHAQIIVIK